MDDFTTWLRQRIKARMALAQGTIELGNNAEWQELSSGVLVTGDGTDTDHWDGTWAMGDSTLTRLMEANDPRDTIARCEAELAILDEHKPDRGIDPDEMCCTTCGDYPQVEYPCQTVRLLGAGYRHRRGYLPEWAPETTIPSR